MRPEIIALFIPIVALLIPIVAILVSHQQKMAQLYHKSPIDSPEVNSLRQEIAELKTLVHNQAITLDNIANSQKSLGAPPPPPNL